MSGTLTVSFAGREFDVSAVPRVMVGETLQVTHNPYQPDAAVVVDADAEGNELLHTVPLVARGEGGFRADAPVIGEDWGRPADTVADANRKLVERVAMEAATEALARL